MQSTTANNTDSLDPYVQQWRHLVARGSGRSRFVSCLVGLTCRALGAIARVLVSSADTHVDVFVLAPRPQQVKAPAVKTIGLGNIAHHVS